MPEPPVTRSFRILSLDGGGVRGAFAAGFFAELEQRLQSPIADHFDLIAGTSTGGIIAAALAVGEPADRIEQFYRTRGPTIFRRWWEQERGRNRVEALIEWLYRLATACPNLLLRRWGVDWDWLREEKYDHDCLKAALGEVFGDKTITHIQNTRLVLTTFDLASGRTKVLKTPHFPGLIRDGRYLLRDAILSTTAAPTYFRPLGLESGMHCIDGGVWANNPSMVAIAEALKIHKENGLQGQAIDLKSIQLLSVGTGEKPFCKIPKRSGGTGMLWWGKDLLDVVFTAQAQGVSNLVSYFLNPDQYLRVDFPIPSKGNWDLDSTEHLPELIQFGRSKATEHLQVLKSRFFAHAAG